MNIVHVTTYLQGGAGKVICDLAIAQKKLRNNVWVITSDENLNNYCNYDNYLRTLEKNQVKVIAIDSSFKREYFSNFKVIEILKNILKDEDIDIIHTHAAIPSMIGLIARSGFKKYIPVIQTMHGWGTNKTDEHELVDVTVLNSIDKVITVSNADKNLLILKGVQCENIKTIYNGIKENETIITEENDILYDIKRYKDKGFKVIGTIGSICERKNQELLVQAIKNMEKDVFLPMIGEGDYIKYLESIAEKFGIKENVKFYGYRDNASQYIKFFDFLCLPSKSEGMPITVIESFREKIPVIGSDIECIKELIQDEKTGFVFNNNSVNSLKETLYKALNHKHNKILSIKDNAHKKYLKEFTFDTMIYKYNSLYKNKLNNGDKDV